MKLFKNGQILNTRLIVILVAGLSFIGVSCKQSNPSTAQNSETSSDSADSGHNTVANVSTLMKEGFSRTFHAIRTPMQFAQFLHVLDTSFDNIANQNRQGDFNPFKELQSEIRDYQKKNRVPDDALLKVWDGKISGGIDKEADVALMASLLIPLKAFSGIFWRMEGLLKPGKGEEYRRILISSIVGQVSGSRLLSIGDPQSTKISDVITDYVSQPWWSSFRNRNFVTKHRQFSTMVQLQKQVDSNWFGENSLGQVSINRVENILAALRAGSQKDWISYNADFLFDTKAVDSDFKDIRVGKAEVHELLSGLYLARHNARLFTGTNLARLMEFNHQLYLRVFVFGGSNIAGGRPGDIGNAISSGGLAGAISGLFSGGNGLGFRNIDFAILLKDFPALFTISSPENYKMAFDDLKTSISHLETAFDATKTWSEDEGVDPFYLNPFRIVKLDKRSRNTVKKAINNLKVMVGLNTNSGPVAITNPITGENVSVKLAGFYLNKAQGFDLKQYAPGTRKSGQGVSFVSDHFRKAKSPYKDSIRDYRAGTPISRNYGIYQNTIFPDLKGGEESFKRHVQTLTTAFGTVGAAAPIFIMY